MIRCLSVYQRTDRSARMSMRWLMSSFPVPLLFSSQTTELNSFTSIWSFLDRVRMWKNGLEFSSFNAHGPSRIAHRRWISENHPRRLLLLRSSQHHRVRFDPFVRRNSGKSSCQSLRFGGTMTLLLLTRRSTQKRPFRFFFCFSFIFDADFPIRKTSSTEPSKRTPKSKRKIRRRYVFLGSRRFSMDKTILPDIFDVK